MTLGIFGGTFDPIHTGHLIVARAALETLGMAEVLFVPAGKPWMKAGEDVSPREDRARMVELAVAGDPQFGVSRLEVERRGETYTLDTLRALPAEGGRPVLLLGADAFAGFPAWREPSEIARLARIAVLGRPGRDTAAIIDEVKAEVPNVDAAPLEAPLIEISATAIRDRVRRGLPIRDLVPPAVADYIADRGLYRSDGQPSAGSRRNRLKEIIETRAVMRGSFTLASGKTSSYYFDGRRATHDPDGACLIGELVAELLGPGVDAIGGPATAAKPHHHRDPDRRGPRRTPHRRLLRAFPDQGARDEEAGRGQPPRPGRRRRDRGRHHDHRRLPPPRHRGGGGRGLQGLRESSSSSTAARAAPTPSAPEATRSARSSTPTPRAI